MDFQNGRKVGLFFTLALMATMWVFVFPSTRSFAQGQDFDPSIRWTDQWRKEGQLVTVQISRGNPIRIFIVGREEAKIEPSTMSLTVRRVKPYPAKILTVDKFNNYFVISDSKEFNKSNEIEVVTQVKDKDKTFRFELKKEAP